MALKDWNDTETNSSQEIAHSVDDDDDDGDDGGGDGCDLPPPSSLSSSSAFPSLCFPSGLPSQK